MYKLVHTHTKSKIAHALSYAIHTFYASPQYQACSKSRERYYNSFNPQEKIKQDSKLTIFVFRKIFNVFGFFFNKQNNLRK